LRDASNRLTQEGKFYSMTTATEVQVPPVTEERPTPTREELVSSLVDTAKAWEADKRKAYDVVRAMRAEYGISSSTIVSTLTGLDLPPGSPVLRGKALTEAVAITGYDPEMFSDKGLVVKAKEIVTEHEAWKTKLRKKLIDWSQTGYFNRTQLDTYFDTLGQPHASVVKRLEVHPRAFFVTSSSDSDLTSDSSRTRNAAMKELFLTVLKEKGLEPALDGEPTFDTYVSEQFA
jgi:hypothetical protein